jgi:hemerythrin
MAPECPRPGRGRSTEPTHHRQSQAASNTNAEETTMLNWSHDYETGNSRIDLQHETFLGLVNEFQQIRLAGHDKDKLCRTLREICYYATFHFHSEENVMTDSGYPDLEAHRLHHYALLEILNNKVLGLQMGLYDAESIEEFLIQWFVQHVKQEDMKIGQFLKAATLRDPTPPGGVRRA